MPNKSTEKLRWAELHGQMHGVSDYDYPHVKSYCRQIFSCEELVKNSLDDMTRGGLSACDECVRRMRRLNESETMRKRNRDGKFKKGVK